MKIVAITLLSVCLSMPVVLAQDGDDWIEDLNTLNAQQEAWNNAWEARQDRYQRQREESQRTHDHPVLGGPGLPFRNAVTPRVR